MNVLEQDFMKRVMLALGNRQGIRLHRQNVGRVEVAKKGKIVGVFEAGPPTGAADLSGIVGPEGWRIELEIKSAKAEDRDAQEGWKRMIVAHGGIHVKTRYVEALTMQENIEATLTLVEEAIQKRRSTV